MRKPHTHPGASLLAASIIAALLGWPHAAPAGPLIHALAMAGAQDRGDVDDEEDDGDEESDDQDVPQAEADEEDEVQDMEDEESDDQDVPQAEADEEDDVQAEDTDDEESDDEDVPQAQMDEDRDSLVGQALSDDTDDGDADAMQDADDEDELPGDDFNDDRWASGWEIDDAPADEADDVIPIDHARFGNDVVWQVVDEDNDNDSGDFVGGNLPSIRTSRPAPRTAGSKPPRQPGDDEDTVYSFGGLPVTAQSVPWQAQILYPGAPPKANDKRPAWQRQHYCGGALIAADWVLTAAHCLDQNEVDAGFKVRLGAQDISRGDGVLYKIDRIVRHSQYNNESNDVNNPPNMYANDIALVHIVADGQSVPIDSRRIRQIPLNRNPLSPGLPVSATGWGVTGSSESANTMNAVLLRVDLQAMPNPVCQQRPGYGPQKIKDGVFCAANPKQSTCRGDSGGPVILTNGTPLLVGIVSWGKKACAGDGRPGVYTRVDRYAQWIDEAMKLPAGRNRLP